MILFEKVNFINHNCNKINDIGLVIKSVFFHTSDYLFQV